MLILHFHLRPQFKNELFHIYFTLFQTSLIMQFYLICQMLAKFSGLNPKGPYLSLEKEKKKLFCVAFTYSVKRAREIRKFHVAVLQGWLKNVQKSVMHVQSSCFYYPGDEVGHAQKRRALGSRN